MRRFSQLLSLGFVLLVNACMADVEPPSNDPAIPVVSYDGESMTRVSVSLTGSFTARNPEIVEYGFDLAEGSFSGGAAKTVLAERTEEGSFTSVATIEPGKHYVVKSWFSNGKQKKYSQEKAISAPLTSAATLTDVTYAGGRLTATVVDDGGRTINEVGFCWGKTKDVRDVKRSNKRQATLSGNTFSLDVAEFMPGETYYLLAYAENSEDASVDIYGYSRNLLELSVSYDDYVDIEDDNFESYLVANFDTDHNGWMSFGELAAITAIDVVTDKIVTVKEIDLMPDLKRLAVAGSTAQSGRLMKLDVSKNNKLTTLICDNNQLDSLVVAACRQLDTLSCAGNRIRQLDVTGEKYLKSLKIGNNPLESEVDISYCDGLTEFSADNCSALKTIYVWLTFDEGEYADFRKDPGAEYVIAPHINIPIPDANFKKYLVENFDLNGDGEINGDEAYRIEKISVFTDDIVSLSGIRYFPKLTALVCSGTRDNEQKGYGMLSEIDVSNNYLLTELVCRNNQLTKIDVSKNDLLETLACSDNQLTDLDVTNNPNLKYLSCYHNLITELNVADNPALVTLECAGNKLSMLDVGNNVALTGLFCAGNKITALDVGNNINLRDLACGGNLLSSLSVRENSALVAFFCEYNQIKSLDVSNCRSLRDLSCSGNQLTELDVSQNPDLSRLWCQGNQLICLDISNNSLLSDVKCDNVNVPDANFKKYLIENFDRDGDAEVSLAEASLVQAIDVCTDEIQSLTGIEAFLNMKSLSCYGSMGINADGRVGMGLLSSLDLVNNKKLVRLNCNYNSLTKLNVSNNKLLSILECASNQLTSLDVSANSSLTDLVCPHNILSELDVSHNTMLHRIYCSSNHLQSLDVGNNADLSSIICSDNQLTSLDISENSKLSLLMCSNNKLTNLSVSNNPLLQELYCTSNQLTSLDVSNNSFLSTLACYYNPNLTKIWLKTGQTIKDFSFDASITTIQYK